MNRSKIIPLSIIIIIPIIFFIILRSGGGLPPESYRALGGPSTDILRTRGQFRPGGYIIFTLSPEMESMAGNYEADIRSWALLQARQSIDDALWPVVNESKGTPALGERTSAKSETFTIEHEVKIPNDPALAGKRLVFKLFYEINYPKITGLTSGVNTYEYRNVRETISQEISITLSNEPLTPEELAWLERDSKSGGIIEVVQIILFIGWFTAIVAFIMSFIKR